MIRIKNILLISILLMSCNIDNTTDPRCSISIKDAKEKGLFLSNYKVFGSDSIFNIEESWLECSWKYKQTIGRVAIEKFSDLDQLVFTIKKFNDTSLNSHNFLLSWGMQEVNEPGNYLGRWNGVYALTFNKLEFPDTVKVNIFKIDNSNKKNYYSHFFLIKK